MLTFTAVVLLCVLYGAGMLLVVDRYLTVRKKIFNWTPPSDAPGTTGKIDSADLRRPAMIGEWTTLVFITIIGLSLHYGIGIVVFLLLGTVLASNLKKLKAKPYFLALPTLWGKPLEHCTAIQPGLRYFPGRFVGWHDGIAELAETIDYPVFKLRVRCRDGGEIEVPVGLTVDPDQDNLAEYIRRGGKEQIKGILEGIVKQAVREWAGSERYGPATSVAALHSQKEVASTLLDLIAGANRASNGKVQLLQWGIIIVRLTVEDILPVGKLIGALEREVVEEYETRGELREIEAITRRADLLLRAASEQGHNLTYDQAVRIIEIQQGKTHRRFYDVNVPDELLTIGLRILKRMA